MDQPSIGGVEAEDYSLPAIYALTGGIIPASGTTLPGNWLASWGMRWEPEEVDLQAGNKTRKLYKYNIGYRIHIKFKWGYLTRVLREQIVISINAGREANIRVWPHGDRTDWYFDCIYDKSSNVDSYKLGEPIGYDGFVHFKGVILYPQVPLWERGYYYTDKDDFPIGGVGKYTAADEILCYTRAADVLADNYLDSDVIGFYWKDRRSLEA